MTVSITSLHVEHTFAVVAAVWTERGLAFVFDGNPYAVTLTSTTHSSAVSLLDDLVAAMNAAVGGTPFAWDHDDDWLITVAAAGHTWTPTFTAGTSDQLWAFIGFHRGTPAYGSGAASHVGTTPPWNVWAHDGTELEPSGVVGAVDQSTAQSGEQAAAGFGSRRAARVVFSMIPRADFSAWDTWLGLARANSTTGTVRLTHYETPAGTGAAGDVLQSPSAYVLAQSARDLRPSWAFRNQFFSVNLDLLEG